MNKVGKKTGKVSEAWTKYFPHIGELLYEVRRIEISPDYVQSMRWTTFLIRVYWDLLY